MYYSLSLFLFTHKRNMSVLNRFCYTLFAREYFQCKFHLGKFALVSRTPASIVSKWRVYFAAQLLQRRKHITSKVCRNILLNLLGIFNIQIRFEMFISRPRFE